MYTHRQKNTIALSTLGHKQLWVRRQNHSKSIICEWIHTPCLKPSCSKILQFIASVAAEAGVRQTFSSEWIYDSAELRCPATHKHKACETGSEHPIIHIKDWAYWWLQTSTDCLDAHNTICLYSFMFGPVIISPRLRRTAVTNISNQSCRHEKHRQIYETVFPFHSEPPEFLHFWFLGHDWICADFAAHKGQWLLCKHLHVNMFVLLTDWGFSFFWFSNWSIICFF